jgi:FkbM family methyltransferase
MEPILPVKQRISLEFHGSEYGGWPIAANSLDQGSIIVDIGLGEDISFSESLVKKYGCHVYGFDPTPKSIEYVKNRRSPNFSLFEVGVAAERGEATFYLPNYTKHVSGSLFCASHVGQKEMTVPLIGIDEIPKLIGTEKLALIKLDIEGAEFDLLDAPSFGRAARHTNQICIEFHHRWPQFGKGRTLCAVKRLEKIGFHIAWVSPSNEEVLFVRSGIFR